MSAFRATRTLLKRVPESPEKYHYTEGQTPFWRKVRHLLSLNPYVTSLIAGKSRPVCPTRCWCVALQRTLSNAEPVSPTRFAPGKASDGAVEGYVHPRLPWTLLTRRASLRTYYDSFGYVFLHLPRHRCEPVPQP